MNNQSLQFGLLTTISILTYTTTIFPPSVTLAQSDTNCFNYWVNPSTGLTECLDGNIKKLPSHPKIPNSPPEKTVPNLSPAQSSETTANQIHEQLTFDMTFQQVVQLIGFQPNKHYKKPRYDWEWQYQNGREILMSVEIDQNQEIGTTSLSASGFASPDEQPRLEALSELMDELRELDTISLKELEAKIGQPGTLVSIDVFIWQIGNRSIAVEFKNDQLLSYVIS